MHDISNAPTKEEAMRRALLNIAQFDFNNFALWLQERTPAVVWLAEHYPPTGSTSSLPAATSSLKATMRSISVFGSPSRERLRWMLRQVCSKMLQMKFALSSQRVSWNDNKSRRDAVKCMQGEGAIHRY